MTTLHYGHKERHGSMFLTAFAFERAVDMVAFLAAINEAAADETASRTFVRLCEAGEPSKNGLPTLTCWWGGDRGSEERGESELGDPWFVMDLLDNAVEATAKKLGFDAVKRLGHSAYVAEV